MFSNPELNVAKLGLKDGMKVADFGAGTGMYSKAAAQRVGPNGKVYAIEVQKDLVKKLENDIKIWKLSNIECIWGDIEKKHGTKIADGTIDAVIISNVLFQAEDKLGLIDEAKRVLGKDGKVLLIDWADSFGGMGPTPLHIINQQKAIEIFSSRGFKFSENVVVSDHHYGIIFIHE
jgi:ubiquinone/menaquinone biosynthesis C-methylase UbiE